MESGGDYPPLMQRRAWTIGGMKPDERLMGQVSRYAAKWVPAPECEVVHLYGEDGWRPGGVDKPHEHFVVPPTKAQVAMVLHALADHTALKQAINWIPIDGVDPVDSLGRWMHDLGDYLEHPNE